MNDKRGEGEEEHDTVEGDAHTIISCIIFSMSCVLFLIVIVFVYDVVKYTKFGRNYLTVSSLFWVIAGYIDVDDGCWRQSVLVTTIAYSLLVTVLAILVSNINFLFTLVSGTNIKKVSPTPQNRHQL